MVIKEGIQTQPSRKSKISRTYLQTFAEFRIESCSFHWHRKFRPILRWTILLPSASVPIFRMKYLGASTRTKKNVARKLTPSSCLQKPISSVYSLNIAPRFPSRPVKIRNPNRRLRKNEKTNKISSISLYLVGEKPKRSSLRRQSDRSGELWNTYLKTEN